MTTNQTLGKLLYEAHHHFLEPSLIRRRFKHRDILPLIENLKTTNAEINRLGYSVEQRPIFEVKLGKGKKNVMLWTQMHGNEPTSTMAVFDMIRFLQANEKEYEEVRNTILEHLELSFIPMLNPDGVERFQRRNAVNIDLNRDAANLACPESRILKAAHQKNKPIFGFNLHDQSKHYNVPGTKNTATHSFLAPAYDYEKNINETRKAAMQGIALMQEVLDEIHPNHSGRYNDDFEPRAFGDNIQSWGTSTILVEAGGLRNDPEKQEIRRMHFSILLTLLYNIATDHVKDYRIEKYWSIPENDRKLNDLIIRSVYFTPLDKEIDISINLEEIECLDQNSFYSEGVIEDLGDLSTFYGYEEFDAKGMKYLASKTYEQTFSKNEDIFNLNPKELLRQGIAIIRTSAFRADPKLDNLPLLIIESHEKAPNQVKSGNKCAFFLEGDKGIEFAVINGKMIKI